MVSQVTFHKDASAIAKYIFQMNENLRIKNFNIYKFIYKLDGKIFMFILKISVNDEIYGFSDCNIHNFFYYLLY